MSHEQVPVRDPKGEHEVDSSWDLDKASKLAPLLLQDKGFRNKMNDLSRDPENLSLKLETDEAAEGLIRFTEMLYDEIPELFENIPDEQKDDVARELYGLARKEAEKTQDAERYEVCAAEIREWHKKKMPMGVAMSLGYGEFLSRREIDFAPDIALQMKNILNHYEMSDSDKSLAMIALFETLRDEANVASHDAGSAYEELFDKFLPTTEK
ncbi:hypothetical protein KC871_03695 [Candidatus Saccharibacteria bacterium]|nr:hypothetical protein [Candidatus Saccharibacteria bacterium]MCA9351055.1 hypothetical protein [Candidatus Saccharibacteria bacterium]MCB9816923.1 hypothetical protein [Candidatus Nomurabacteria bacterium]HPD99034.1 hypothetical protein [Candidatus Saccharibacteria bacterium]